MKSALLLLVTIFTFTNSFAMDKVYKKGLVQQRIEQIEQGYKQFQPDKTALNQNNITLQLLHYFDQEENKVREQIQHLQKEADLVEKQIHSFCNYSATKEEFAQLQKKHANLTTENKRVKLLLDQTAKQVQDIAQRQIKKLQYQIYKLNLENNNNNTIS